MNTLFPTVLKELYDKNDNEAKQKINAWIDQKKRPSDGKGFVYGFDSPSDVNRPNNFWIKMGRTEHPKGAETRIASQHGAQRFALLTSHNQRSERLVHRFFQYARIYSRPNSTEWFHFKEDIDVTDVIMYVTIIVGFVEKFYRNIESTSDAKISINIAHVGQEENVAPESKININTATANTLMTLTRIGPGKAKNIILYRQTHVFTRIEDIKRVRGIADGTFTKIRDNITV